MNVKIFTALEKKNNCAVFLGCGNSINTLTLDQEKFLSDNFDVWASNNFMVHNRIVPNFYHVEIKDHRNGPLVRRLSKQRSESYKDVSWIIDVTRPYILNYVSPEDYRHENFHVYPKAYRNENHGKYNPDINAVSVTGNASVSVIMDIMVRMKYDTIYFLGVDMNDSRYFWSDNKDYENVVMEDIVKTCKPDERSPDQPHPTMHMKDFIPEFLEFNNQKSVNLSVTGLLTEKMTTKKIEEVLSEF
jgi:hypothetical protein